MKKSRSFFLILLPLLFLYTGCGDEFGSMSVSNDTYLMFPSGNEPARVEAISYGTAGIVVVRNDMEQLSLCDEYEYGRYRFEYNKTKFHTSNFMKQYEQAEPKPEIFFLLDSEQLSTRRNYTYRIVFYLTNKDRNIEEEEIIINIPYLEEGDIVGMDLILETKNYGKIPVFFRYYFTRSI